MREEEGVTACMCPSCAAVPAPTFLPAFRLECEARAVLAWPIEARREYLASRPVQGRRADLEEVMRRQFDARRGHGEVSA